MDSVGKREGWPLKHLTYQTALGKPQVKYTRYVRIKTYKSGNKKLLIEAVPHSGQKKQKQMWICSQEFYFNYSNSQQNVKTRALCPLREHRQKETILFCKVEAFNSFHSVPSCSGTSYSIFIILLQTRVAWHELIYSSHNSRRDTENFQYTSNQLLYLKNLLTTLNPMRMGEEYGTAIRGEEIPDTETKLTKEKDL